MLLDLDMDQKPTLFMVASKTSCDKFCCGVMEFIEEPGICYLPFHVFDKLKLTYGGEILVESHCCPLGEKIHIQPEETAFLDIIDPKRILEETIGHRYPVLTKGGIILLDYGNREYRIRVTQTCPDGFIKTHDCDLVVEFEEPLDFQAIKKSKEEQEEHAKQEALAAQPSHDTTRFPGTGCRLGQ